MHDLSALLLDAADALEQYAGGLSALEPAGQQTRHWDDGWASRPSSRDLVRRLRVASSELSRHAGALDLAVRLAPRNATLEEVGQAVAMLESGIWEPRSWRSPLSKRLAAAVSELVLDAERYRWLRSQNGRGRGAPIVVRRYEYMFGRYSDIQDLDAAIDTARSGPVLHRTGRRV
ncbi:hypothetical protein [Pigmentiphaga sp.]|uniref:hypothetical protein n=1 Tax=Pigmentiphaga sp. TaxID=1977564 RepID=UPI0025D65A6E|nr:hypothetical protein [Pigmentiphaga sp.]MBX6318760.1 hypothetical protein [Pigmentiphaga sp.]